MYEEGVERPRDRADRVLHEAHALPPPVVAHDHRAADGVGVPAEVLRGRVHDGVRAVARAAAGRRAWRTCCPRPRARPACARPPRATSTTFSIGFVGVSTQIRRVSSRTARCERVQVGLVDQGVLEAPAREHLVHQPERPAVQVVGQDDVIAGRGRPW